MMIDDWKDAWRFLSIQVASLWATGTVIWIGLTDEQHQRIMEAIGLTDPAVIQLVGFVLVVIGRMIAQSPARQAVDTNQSE
jgi:hypothetical protein